MAKKGLATHASKRLFQRHLLRQNLEPRPTKTDLNELVAATLASLDGRLKVSLTQDLCPLPMVVVDPEQMQKVLLNLLLNAYEAVGEGGEILVITEKEGRPGCAFN